MWREYFLLWIFASLLSEVRFPTRLIDKAVSDGFFFGTHKAVKKFTDHCCNYLKNAAQCLRCNLFWYKLKLNPVTHNSQFMLVQQHFASLYFISPAQQLYMLTPLEALCIELIAYRRKQALLLFMIIVLSFFVYILIRLICMSLW